jgi:hypothetical protein
LKTRTGSNCTIDAERNRHPLSTELIVISLVKVIVDRYRFTIHVEMSVDELTQLNLMIRLTSLSLFVPEPESKLRARRMSIRKSQPRLPSLLP